MIGKLNLCFGDWTPGQHWFQQILGGGLDSISGLYKFPKLFNVSHLKPSFYLFLVMQHYNLYKSKVEF